MLRQDAETIIQKSLVAVSPGPAVSRALSARSWPEGKTYLVAIGKAAWSMAKQAECDLGQALVKGICITKHGHVEGPLQKTVCYEAGHPVPDAHSFEATRAVLDLVSGLGAEDQVVFLVSGGGSALFEEPVIPPIELQEITRQMLASGADIQEMNTIRKRLSAVKGGKFARRCAPASIFSIILSDIIGDPLDMIASGPAYPDGSTCAEALALVKKYGWQFSDEAMAALAVETPKSLDNVTTVVTGSVSELCRAAADQAQALGYESQILTDVLDCEAREAGYFLGALARSQSRRKGKKAFLAGGETVVHLKGQGKGGRNQELALAAAEKLAGLDGVAVFSFGSDGTDGPTDAAGGYVDGQSKAALEKRGKRLYEYLEDNDAYHALQQIGGLLITGPTGTNVNDVSIVLIDQ